MKAVLLFVLFFSTAAIARDEVNYTSAAKEHVDDIQGTIAHPTDEQKNEMNALAEKAQQNKAQAKKEKKAKKALKSKKTHKAKKQPK